MRVFDMPPRSAAAGRPRWVRAATAAAVGPAVRQPVANDVHDPALPAALRRGRPDVDRADGALDAEDAVRLSRRSPGWPLPLRKIGNAFRPNASLWIANAFLTSGGAGSPATRWISRCVHPNAEETAIAAASNATAATRADAPPASRGLRRTGPASNSSNAARARVVCGGVRRDVVAEAPDGRELIHRRHHPRIARRRASSSRTRPRARLSRLRTVPTGMPSAAAISA